MKTIYLVLLIGLMSMGCSAKGSLNYTPPTLSPVSTKAATTSYDVAEVLAATAAYAEDNFYTLEPATPTKKSISFSFDTKQQLKYVDCGIMTSNYTSKVGRKRDLTSPAAAESYNLQYMEGRALINEQRSHHMLCTVTVTPRPAGNRTAVDISVRYSLEGLSERRLNGWIPRASWPYRVVFTSQVPSVKPAQFQCQTNGALEKEIFKGIMAMVPQTKVAAPKKK